MAGKLADEEGPSAGWSLEVGGRPDCTLSTGPGTTRSDQKPEFIIGLAPKLDKIFVCMNLRMHYYAEFGALDFILDQPVGRLTIRPCKLGTMTLPNAFC